jgi:hypothetical protein
MLFKKNSLCLILSLIVLSLTSSFAHANEHKDYDDETRFSLGVLGGYGIGYENKHSTTSTGAAVPAHGWYQFAPLMISGAYQFTPANSTRISVGMDYYTKNSPFKKVYFAAEGDYIYHFIYERGTFNPYFIAGFRVPTFNIGIGLGNEFYVSETVSVLIEVMANSYFTLDNKAEGRVGVMWHF